MKAIRTLLGLLRGYPGWISAHVVFNALTAIFTVLTIPLVMPIMMIFFDSGAEPLVPPDEHWTIADLPNRVNYFLTAWIREDASMTSALIKSCSVLIGVFLLKNLCQYLAFFTIAPVRTSVMRDLRQMVYDKMTMLPLSFYSDERRGDLLSRFSNDTNEIEFSILGVIERIVRDPLILIGALGYMFSVSPKLALMVLGIILLTGLIIGGISSRLKRQSKDVQHVLGRLVATVEETIAGMQVVKAFNAEDFMKKRLRTDNNQHSHLLTRLLWRKDSASPLSEVLGIAAVCVLLVLGAYMVESEEIQPDIFLTFIFAFYQTINPAKMVASGYAQILKGSAAYERIDHILSQVEDVRPNATITELPEMHAGLHVEDVRFSYAGGLPDVLHGVSFKIPKGQTVALVGSSGSGKTTMAEILMGFHLPHAGQILFDDIRMSDVALQTWRSQMGMVTQKPILFNDTIRANIAFGRAALTDEDIIRAAKLAYAHDFIEKLQGGYDHMVGDEGQKLSGGQRQRIAIARAIAANPDILILDEATSALDAESEKAVQRALEQVLADRTAVIIAHRLSTIKHADHILVFEDGQIIEQGAHADLIDMDGAYTKFVQLQSMHS